MTKITSEMLVVSSTEHLPELDAILYTRPAGRNIIGAAVDEIKRLRACYSGSGQRIQDLSDEVGLLEETNKKQHAEVERLRAEVRALTDSRDASAGIAAAAIVHGAKRRKSLWEQLDHD